MAFHRIEKSPKLGTMGIGMMRIGGLFIPEAKESIEMMYQFNKPFVVDSSKFIDQFGDISTPLDEALAKTVEWYSQRHHHSS